MEFTRTAWHPPTLGGVSLLGTEALFHRKAWLSARQLYQTPIVMKVRWALRLAPGKFRSLVRSSWLLSRQIRLHLLPPFALLGKGRRIYLINRPGSFQT